MKEVGYTIRRWDYCRTCGAIYGEHCTAMDSGRLLLRYVHHYRRSVQKWQKYIVM